MTFNFNIPELVFLLVCFIGAIVVIASFLLLFSDDE
jgi:hypothetical protein